MFLRFDYHLYPALVKIKVCVISECLYSFLEEVIFRGGANEDFNFLISQMLGKLSLLFQDRFIPHV